MRKRFCRLGMLIAFCGCFFTSEVHAERIFLNIGTTNKTSILYPYYVNMIKIFRKYAPDLKPTVIETGAAVDNINRLAKGQIDIGMVMDSTAYEAYNGLGKWQGTPVKDLRAVLTYAVNSVPYVVTEESGITNAEQLQGKPVSPGMRGSGNEAVCESVFSALGIQPEWFRGSLSDAADAMKDRRIVCVNKTSNGLSPDATFIELQTFIRLNVIDWTPEQIAKVREVYPYFKTAVQPTGSLNAQTKDATTWATYLGDAAMASMSEKAIYMYVKACFEGKEEQSKVYAAAGQSDFIAATLDMGITLQKGTVKYFREIGVQIPEQLIPVEAK